VEAGELAIFESSADAIDFHADADTEFVLGRRLRTPTTSLLDSTRYIAAFAMLRAGEQQLSEIQRRLRTKVDSESRIGAYATVDALVTRVRGEYCEMPGCD